MEIENPKELSWLTLRGGELKHAYHSLEMASPTKICLHWDDFQNNLTSTFKELRQDTDFADVTLVCEDGTKVDAHRLILAWSSPILMDIMNKTKQPQTLIYMRGTRLMDLAAVLDFLYTGEAQVEEDNLESFLALANDLQLKGLTRDPLSEYSSDRKQLKSSKSPKKENPMSNNAALPTSSGGKMPNKSQSSPKMISKFRDVDEEIRSMVGISENPPPGKSQGRARVCKVGWMGNPS